MVRAHGALSPYKAREWDPSQGCTPFSSPVGKPLGNRTSEANKAPSSVTAIDKMYLHPIGQWDESTCYQMCPKRPSESKCSCSTFALDPSDLMCPSTQKQRQGPTHE
eukprot:gene22090-8670_t